ncbi:MAG TPA: glycoside hydrolase family 15 protein [Sulfurovum sp.]|nr:glycoside hydrolase family 15 protein [Sulfurovum sp.]HQS72024.1 glycoside hydrolase family 15 protein [Sulfurovum sp.]HQS77423.1 glycoside hydrolase family 15 protein [Sulfurovum sp.]HQT27942.1 glycoside hydrolase family 15 protein [Sulfurovum sp.]
MNQELLQVRLDRHFEVIEKIILRRQDAVTGLLPASTAVNAHGDYTDAWVRDNVYSILSVWGLALAYKKYNPLHHRTFVLSGSVVKLMRGLLLAMMRQSDRVEAFKNTHNPCDALHAKYGTHTGLAVVGDDEWGHLQLDATSLYLLMLAQMTASGLRLIYTMDEVHFVQNLVHYISHAYCTADYGIWERGNKINHGTTEINGSSVGMAKAALEALDGFNLFGNTQSKEAVIHVVLSDVARSRATLQGLLPRESNSKETDAALLSIIGYPAYAVEDEKLLKRTRDKILKKLAGNYGCKRFLLDGHQSSIEDASRLHYEPSELREFEHIESEWPLFFTYLLLDALMRDDKDAVQHWHDKLQPLFVVQDGVALLPELYIVPKASIVAEKQNPGSQERYANENIPLVWAQSLYMLSDMMLDGLLLPEDIDPLNRRACIGKQTTVKPLVPVLAENEAVKEQLLQLGFLSQTVAEVKPLKIMYASVLSAVHTLVGKNTKLGLTGRPFAVTRTIATSRVHELMGAKVIFLPYYFNPQGFYFSYDNTLLAEHFRASLKFLCSQWNKSKQPFMPFLVREAMFGNEDKRALLDLLSDIHSGVFDGIPIQTGSIEAMLSSSDVECIDGLDGFNLEEHELVFYTESAVLWHDWSAIRDLAESNGRYDDRLEDVLLDIIIRQKRLAVGRAYSEKATFSQPSESRAIVQTIKEFCGNNRAESTLTQEIILHLGYLIRSEPELFEHILTLRTWYFIQLLVGKISREQHLPMGEAYERLLGLAPHLIYNCVRDILKSFSQEVKSLLTMENLHSQGTAFITSVQTTPMLDEADGVKEWARWREERGMVGAFSQTFYKDIWYVLRQCSALVIGEKFNKQNRMGAEFTLDATAGERSFALKIDALLQSIAAPDYRQLNIEALESLVRLFRQNPQLYLQDDLILDVLIGHAVRVAWQKHHHGNYDEHRAWAWEAFYKLSPSQTDEAFIEAFMYLLLPQEESITI